MKLILILSLATVGNLWGQPYINSDVYDYLWDGQTENEEACTIYKRHAEDFYAGPPPYPTNQEITQYAPLPCQYNNTLVESRIVWSSAAMTSAYELQLHNNVIVSSNSVEASSYQPLRLTEMANYTDLSQTGGSGGGNSRYAHGRTRFWVNACTNGNYHFRATFHGGYWDNWFPGHLTVGDIYNYTTPAKKPSST